MLVFIQKRLKLRLFALQRLLLHGQLLFLLRHQCPGFAQCRISCGQFFLGLFQGFGLITFLFVQLSQRFFIECLIPGSIRQFFLDTEDICVNLIDFSLKRAFSFSEVNPVFHKRNGILILIQECLKLRLLVLQRLLFFRQLLIFGINQCAEVCQHLAHTGRIIRNPLFSCFFRLFFLFFRFKLFCHRNINRLMVAAKIQDSMM
ncbi:hypothetical protein MOMOMMO210B_19540 [Morganella morganii]